MKRLFALSVRMPSRPAQCQAAGFPFPGGLHQSLWQRLCAGVLLASLGGAAVAQNGQLPDGEQVYMDNCSVCHGESGDGKSGARFGLKPPPASFTDNYSASREQMLAVATHGIPGTAMVGWGTRLSDLEIAGAVDYILEAFVESSQGAADPHAGLESGPAPGGSGPAADVPVVPSSTVAEPRQSSAPVSAAEQSQTAGAAHPGAVPYARNCSVCHGENGEGAVWGRQGLNPPPVDFTDEKATQGLTRARMVASVIHGRPGTAMAGFGERIPRDEIEAMVDYIRLEFMGLASSGTEATAKVDASADPEAAQAPALTQPEVAKGVIPRDYMGYEAVSLDAPMPSGLTGNATRGAALFAVNCVACHGVDGAGDGPRAYFIFPKPRNFTSPESRRALNRPAIFTAVQHGVRGREMPGWRHVLSEQEIADVTEYVFKSFIDPR